MKKYKLPKEFAEKWVEALRSGEYKKFQYGYERDGCYCAVGLAYKVNGYKFLTNGHLINEKQNDFIYNNHIDIWKNVTKLNDIEGKSFSEIADWLCANVEFTTP